MSATIDEVIKSNFKVYQDKFQVANEALDDFATKNKDYSSYSINDKYSTPLINEAKKIIMETNFDDYSDFVAFTAFKDLYLIHGRNKDNSSITVNLSEEFINFKMKFNDNPDIISKYLTKAGPKFEVIPSKRVASLNAESFKFFTSLSFISNKFIRKTLHKLGADDKSFFNSFGVGIDSENDYNNLINNFHIFNKLSNYEKVNVTSLENVMELYLKRNNLKASYIFSSPKMIEVNVFAKFIDDELEPFTNHKTTPLMGPINIEDNDEITDLTLKAFNGDYVKTYKFINALCGSKILKSATLFNNMNQCLIFTSFLGSEYKQRVLNNHSDGISYDFKMTGKNDSLASYESINILYKITLEAYELLLSKLADTIDFKSGGNIIDATPGVGEIIVDINDNFLIPEVSERLSLEVTKI